MLPELPDDQNNIQQESHEVLLANEDQNGKEKKSLHEKSKKQRLEIRAIEFDWIFNNKEGVGFLDSLAYTDNIDLFSLNIIRYIIRFFWGTYRKYILLYLFMPF